ncbi:MAG: chromosome segregation protein SMC [Capsulimonadaceae bacterium]
MHLKRLYLRGFKTFADKTTIDFSQGVTAVVGPNGSGKSNVADAILWVLGEQKASAVRGTSAKDVIFSGSDRRRPMGMAEVSLTVDNSDGTLPVEFSEVTITRRAYRTGEGEFFINKVPCRLKDIYELFLDTGVGREAYSLVNQSEIDAVLSVNPEDRRGLFEEAAGIKKYRVKKREALRKLDATDQNLQRVRDILGEIEERIEPLRQEAERAGQYLRLRDRLRQIETNLLIVDLRSADTELSAARRAREAERERVAEQEDAILAARARTADLTDALAAAEKTLDEVRGQHQQAISDAERAESRRALAAQRVAGLEASLGLHAQEIETLGARRERLLGEIAQVSAELDGAALAQSEVQARSAEKQETLLALTGRIADLTRHVERRRAEASALARQHAARQADLARAEARVAEMEAGLPALQAESKRLEALAMQAREEAELAATAIVSARDELATAEQGFAAAREAHDNARRTVHAIQQEQHDLHAKAVSLGSRRRALKDLEDAQEGYYAGVKAVTDAVRRGKLSGKYTVVADAFTIPAGYEVAFETALGGSVQDIVTGTEAEAKAAIHYLYESRLGRATFLPLDRLRPSRDSLDLGRAAGMRGVVGAALDLISFDSYFRPALEVLLGRVFVCEDLDSATEASRVARGWSRIVTMTGDIVSPSGALTGGRQAGRAAGQLLGRKTEIAGLARELQAADAAEIACRERLAAAERGRDVAESGLADRQSAREAAQLAVNESVRKSEFSVSQSRRAADQLDQILRRVDTSQIALARAREHAAAAAEAMQSAGLETADADDAMAAETQLIAKLTAERESLQADATSARVDLATQSEKVLSLTRALRGARADLDLVEGQQAQKAEQSRVAHEEREDLLARSAVRDSEVERAADELVRTRDRLKQQTELRQGLAGDAREAAAGLRRLEDAHAAALEVIHKSDLRETRLEMQRTQLAGRLMEEYEMDAADAIALDKDPEVTDGSPQEVSRLRRELRLMGDVNTGAVEEYDEVSGRFDFLTEQQGDLEGARGKLLDAIKDIDDSTRQVFFDTFQAVGAAFNEIFTRLFRGGRTDLVLTDPEDILETGIDIMVQPPGKKRQNLQLLSGGERALTAAALLFAFLKVKPSPFCVLDEVDAPLDGANVERFSELLAEFGLRSQFIIITHNPTTMEAAPVWYGITMQEPGISRVLSMQAPMMAVELVPSGAEPLRVESVNGEDIGLSGKESNGRHHNGFHQELVGVS